MKHVKMFIEAAMKLYVDSVEGFFMDACNLSQDMMYCAKILLGGLAAVIIYLLVAVTMPVWYLPYKYFSMKK